MIEDYEWLKKYNAIWDKNQRWYKKRNLIASLSIINIIWKSKIKSHGDRITDFYNQKNPKLDSNHTCFAVISLDSALKKDNNY